MCDESVRKYAHAFPKKLTRSRKPPTTREARHTAAKGHGPRVLSLHARRSWESSLVVPLVIISHYSMPKRKANDVEETEEEEEEEKTRVRRSPVRRRRRVNYNEQSDDDDDDDDDTSRSESSGDEEKDDNSSAERSEDEEDSDGSEEDGSNREQEPDEESDDDDDDLTGPPFQCQHCQHTFTGINGLKYHVNNKVCQKAKKERRKTSKARGKSSGKHIRGTMNERTCPQCQKRFTSALGCQYHVGE